MPVQQHILNWLYSVLTSEYHDVNRTYNDVARVLNRYASLAPRIDVHTCPNGTSALLHVSGTLPVIFRGSSYRFPLSLWVPHAYPREPPLIYVTPTPSMIVRPGQHIDPQGQIYHPYLARWPEFWDKSTLEDFLVVLTDVFAKEPPVISRQATAALPPPTTPAVPPPPHTVAAQSTPSERLPPPPPPKAILDRPSADTGSKSGVERKGMLAEVSIPSRYESAPPLPTAARPLSQSQVQTPFQASFQPPIPPQLQAQLRPAPEQEIDHGPATIHHPLPPQGSGGQVSHPRWQPEKQPPDWSGMLAPKQPVPTPPNLLDEPLTLEIPSLATAEAPPIPPNPEKEALLKQLAQTLASIRQRSRQQNESSISGLRAQRSAMQATLPALQSEMNQLSQLSCVLSSNANILRDALHKANEVIEDSRNHPAPDIDELLVAPTVVSNQLYNLVTEERVLGDAIFMLGRAVERGRMPPAMFAKMTRSLAREWYLKKALARKVGKGMGMNV